MITIGDDHLQDGDVQPDVWSAWRCQWNKKGDAVLAKTQVGKPQDQPQLQNCYQAMKVCHCTIMSYTYWDVDDEQKGLLNTGGVCISTFAITCLEAADQLGYQG